MGLYPVDGLHCAWQEQLSKFSQKFGTNLIDSLELIWWGVYDCSYVGHFSWDSLFFRNSCFTMCMSSHFGGNFIEIKKLAIRRISASAWYYQHAGGCDVVSGI
jgi:hypothetical protein